MGAVKLGFEAFILSVEPALEAFVRALHQEFIDAGCKLEVKEAKNGYVVSYTKNRKTVVNYVFRKKGLIVRVYANHIMEYMDILETLPETLLAEALHAPDCKRLLDPTACNPKCAMGYDYLYDGKRYQKCRYSAFQFPLNEESKSSVRAFVLRELAACG